MGRFVLFIAIFVVALAAGAESSSERASERAERVLRLGTTTSVENSGLLGRLLPVFEKECACVVRVIPVGSGRALELGRRGDIDALITHAPADEKRFVADGHGAGRRPIMHNYFVLLGPPSSPAPTGDILPLLAAIADRRLPFVSRGDDSGTHKMELALWRQARRLEAVGADSGGEWYFSAGVGMGQAIIMADELRAHVLSDYGTYLYFRGKTELRPLSRRQPLLRNQYSVVRVNPARHSRVNGALSRLFADWLVAEPAQRLIANYVVGGERLFFPATGGGE